MRNPNLKSICLSERETLNNLEKPKASGLLGVSSAGWWKWIPDLDSAGQKKQTKKTSSSYD